MSIEILDHRNPYDDFTPTVMVRKKKIALVMQSALRWAYRADRIDDHWLFHVPIALAGDFEIEVVFMLNSVVRATSNNQIIINSYVGGASRPLLFFNSWGQHSGERGTLNATSCNGDATIVSYPGFLMLCQPMTIYVAVIKRVAGVMSGTIRLPSGEILNSSTSFSADPAVYNMAGPSSLTSGVERADVTYFNLKVWNQGARSNGVLIGDWDFSDRAGTFFSKKLSKNLAVAPPIWESSTDTKINPDGSFEYNMVDTWGQRAWRIPVAIEWSRTYVLEADVEGWVDGTNLRLTLAYTGANAGNMPFNELRRASFDHSSAFYGSFSTAPLYGGRLRFLFTTAAGSGVMPSAHISLRGAMGSENGKRYKIKNIKLSPAYELAGPEIMRNPALTDLTGTYAAAGATLSNVSGALKCDFVDNVNSGLDLYINGSTPLVPGRFYKLEVDFNAITGPAIQMSFKCFAPTWATISSINVSTARQKIEMVFCAREATGHVTFRPVSAVAGSFTIDNITLRQMDDVHNPCRLVNQNADRWSIVDVGNVI